VGRASLPATGVSTFIEPRGQSALPPRLVRRSLFAYYLPRIRPLFTFCSLSIYCLKKLLKLNRLQVHGIKFRYKMSGNVMICHAYRVFPPVLSLWIRSFL